MGILAAVAMTLAACAQASSTPVPTPTYTPSAPAPDLARAFVNELLGVEMQTKLLPETYAFPSNVDSPSPPGIAADVKVHSLDWQFVAKERAAWVVRWDREMAI